MSFGVWLCFAKPGLGFASVPMGEINLGPHMNNISGWDLFGGSGSCLGVWVSVGCLGLVLGSGPLVESGCRGLVLGSVSRSGVWDSFGALFLDLGSGTRVCERPCGRKGV